MFLNVACWAPNSFEFARVGRIISVQIIKRFNIKTIYCEKIELLTQQKLLLMLQVADYPSWNGFSFTEKEISEVEVFNVPGMTSVTSKIEIEAPEYVFF